jgi:RNA polymerase sigma-70 factor (ECF subfamily)
MMEKPVQPVAPSGEDYTARLQSWLGRLKDGDESALNELLSSFENRLLRLAHKMLKDFPKVRRLEDTSGVLNNSLMRLTRALKAMTSDGRIGGDGTFRTRDFLRLAAKQLRRELLDLAKHYRAWAVMAAGGTEDFSGMAQPVERSGDATHDPHRLAEWTEFHEQVETLPDELREVFDLLWYQELTQAEAAELLGVSDRTVRKRWQEARLKLHHALGGRIPGARSR